MAEFDWFSSVGPPVTEVPYFGIGQGTRLPDVSDSYVIHNPPSGSTLRQRPSSGRSSVPDFIDAGMDWTDRLFMGLVPQIRTGLAQIARNDPGAFQTANRILQSYTSGQSPAPPVLQQAAAETAALLDLIRQQNDRQLALAREARDARLNLYAKQLLQAMDPVRDDLEDTTLHPGYGGIRRFGVRPTEEMIRSMPAFKAREALEDIQLRQLENALRSREEELAFRQSGSMRGSVPLSGTGSVSQPDSSGLWPGFGGTGSATPGNDSDSGSETGIGVSVPSEADAEMPNLPFFSQGGLVDSGQTGLQTPLARLPRPGLLSYPNLLGLSRPIDVEELVKEIWKRYFLPKIIENSSIADILGLSKPIDIEELRRVLRERPLLRRGDLGTSLPPPESTPPTSTGLARTTFVDRPFPYESGEKTEFFGPAVQPPSETPASEASAISPVTELYGRTDRFGNPIVRDDRRRRERGYLLQPSEWATFEFPYPYTGSGQIQPSDFGPDVTDLPYFRRGGIVRWYLKQRGMR